MTELQSLVAESRSAQMSFGAMGISFLPVPLYLFSSCSGETGAYLHCFLSNLQIRFSYPPQYFERRPRGCRACERCPGDLCERIDSY